MALGFYKKDYQISNRIGERQQQSASKYYVGERGDSGGYPPSSGSGGGGSYPAAGYTLAGGHGEMIWAGAGPSKSKKADKKQAAMSALTLIAFLFFLNILQNCLKEHEQESSSPTVVVLDAQMVKAREPDNTDGHVLQDKLIDLEQESNGLGTRRLLSIEDDLTKSEPTRRRKFIHNFGSTSKDWANELTQVTHADLYDQNQKVEKLREVWNHRRREKGQLQQTEFLPAKKHTLENEALPVKAEKFVNNPVLSDLRTVPKLSQYWEGQKPITTTEPKYVDFEEPLKKVADFNEFEFLSGSGASPSLDEMENSLLQKAATNLRYQTAPELDITALPNHSPTAASLVLKPISALGVVEEIPDAYSDTNALNTPRYRRGSEEQSTTYSTEELFRPEASQVTSTPADTSDTTTKRTFHVYTHHPSQMHSGIWHTTPQSPRPRTPHPVTTTTTPEPTPSHKFNIDSIYLTTSRPMPGRIFGAQRHPANHRPYYSPPSRYEYSPYRRVEYEAPLVRHEYYPMSVVGQYGGEGGAGTSMGLLQLLWSMVTSFARPIVSLVPHASKVAEDSPCIELLTCEAHRLAKYMGPTAQVLATTFSSLIRWVTPESERSAIQEALTSADQNSCLKQIETCDQRTGSKSILSVVAKMMEQKVDSREPKKTDGDAAVETAAV